MYITEAFQDQNNLAWLASSLVRAPTPNQEDESSKPLQDRPSNANNVADPGVRSSTILRHKFLINTFPEISSKYRHGCQLLRGTLVHEPRSFT